MHKNVEDLGVEVKSLIEQGNKQVEEKLNGRIDKELLEKTDAALEAHAEATQKMQDHMDTLDATIEKMAKEGNAQEKGASIEAMLQEKMTPEFLSNLKGSQSGFRKGGFELENTFLHRKAVGTMTTANSLTGEVIPVDYTTPVFTLRSNTHIRELFPQGTTTSDTIRVPKETGGEGAVSTVAEGATKPQVDYDFQAYPYPVEKIAGYAKISEEMLTDLSYMSSFLSNTLRNQIMIKEDQQLLYGTGTTPQITGLTIGASSFSAVLPADADAQILDLMIEACAQLETSFYNPNYMVLNPRNYSQLLRTKDADGQYIGSKFWNYQTNRLEPYGVPVVKNTAVTLGTYVIGDFSQGGQIFDRMGVNVRFYDQNEDDAIKNLITVVAEERMTLAIYRDGAWINGTIATDIAKIVNVT